MTRFFKILIGISCGFLLTTCGESEFPAPPYPQAGKISITSINESGVELRSEVTNADKYPIIAHGFLWAKESGFLSTQPNRIDLGELSGNSKFEAQIEHGLEESVRYAAVAFVTTDQKTIYGVKVVFTSKGSASP